MDDLKPDKPRCIPSIDDGQGFGAIPPGKPAPEAPIPIKPKKVKPPKCPYCEVVMTPVRYEGYYESHSYWECDCEKLPGARVDKGYPNG